MKTLIAHFNTWFNGFPIATRRMMALAVGCCFAAICIAIIIKSIFL